MNASTLRRALCAGLMVFACALPARAVTIDLGTGPFLKDNDPHPLIFFRQSVADFNGLALDGTVISFDVLFANDAFLRIFTDSGAVAFQFSFQTNAVGFPGFAGPSTAAIIDASDNAVLETNLAGGMADNGTFGVGYYPEFLARPFDIHALRFHIELPVHPTAQITETFFRIIPRTGPVGVGPHTPADQVPYTANVAGLLAGAVLLLLGFHRLRKSVRWPLPAGL